MLSRHNNKAFSDLSPELSDELDWKAGTLRTLVHHLDITALAYEPVSGILAVGTSIGTIDIYGAQYRGVEHRLELSEPIRIRSLHFAVSLFKLVSVDDHDRLTIWDLTTPGKPKLQSIVNFRHPVNCIALSPSHTHAFAALANGEIQTYDLLCLRMSQYTFPNLWALYEEKVLAGGMPSLSGSGSQFPVELIVHPRDLNLIYVAYGGGVALVDLTKRITLRAFEYQLPPGARGGAGFHDPGLLTHRKPDVTAIAVHPAGHTFAVGYTDGSIAFWALEDEDKPLLAITLDGGHDVNIVDASKLDEVLGKAKDPSDGPREPIFKMTWSGFPNSDDARGGETVLTVLGGLRSDETPGITTLLFPPFNPPEPPAGATTLDSNTRTALRKTVTATKSYVYSIEGVPQDFLLLPRESPHFSGTWDPIGILLLSDNSRDTRALEGYQFPPPSFISALTDEQDKHPPQHPLDGEEAIECEIASTLEFMKSNDDPKPLRLPPSLWSGPGGVLSGHLMSLDRDAYEVLTLGNDERQADNTISLRGGSAWVEDHDGEMKLMKFQPHRVLITHHSDLTVHFRDLSAQVLISSDTAPLQGTFPKPLPHLTIDLVSLLADPAVGSRVSPQILENAHITSSHVAPQSLECAVVLRSGEVAVYRLLSAVNDEPALRKDLEDNELVSTLHVDAPIGRKFRPFFTMITGRGSVAALAISDIGFLAVSYKDGSLFVVDMRGPRVIHRSLPESQSQRRSLLHRHEVDPVQNLTWTVSGTDTNPELRVLLIAVGASGSASIYSLLRSSDGSWTVNHTPEVTEAVVQPIPNASFVLDCKSGKKCRADRAGLARALTSSPDDIEKGKTFWVSAGAKGVRCAVDITGERIAKVDWMSKAGKVERVSIVQKNAATVLVAHTDKREALVYSLPHLEHMHSLQIYQSSPEPLSIDDTGDYVEWIRHSSGLIHSEKYGTLFNVRRLGPYAPPHVDFTYARGTTPPAPQPVSLGPPSLLSSWLGYITTQGMTGDQVDALLAGPDRPIPKPKAPRPTSVQSTKTIDSSSHSGSSDAQNLANSASAGVSSLYARLGNALAERGEMLGGLEESFQSLESGSKNMLNQAKTMAAKQGAKKWFQLS